MANIERSKYNNIIYFKSYSNKHIDSKPTENISATNFIPETNLNNNDDIEESTKVRNLSEVLGRSLVKKLTTESLEEDVDTFIANPNIVYQNNKFSDSAFSYLQQNNIKNAYELSCLMAKDFYNDYQAD